MHLKTNSFFILVFLSALFFSPSPCSAKSIDTNSWENDIPPRLQWDANSGYCGEVCLISAGLYYGQYISQYDARAIATKHAKQNKSQLLLGVNDHYAASQMHLNSIEWKTNKEQSTDQFLVWVKKNVIKGYPVAIGVYTNEYLFYNNKNPTAGDQQYDHIVLVNGIDSNHPFCSHYHQNDRLSFSDNGLWGNSSDTPYEFSYTFENFQANRVQANAKHGDIYALSNSGINYGIVFTGVKDLNGETLPIRLDTNINEEKPAIKDGSTIRPAAEPLTLTITVSHLEPHVAYNLYRYNDFAKVPDSHFNAHADQASERWRILISSGDSYLLIQEIQSNERAIYRAVKASAQ